MGTDDVRNERELAVLTRELDGSLLRFAARRRRDKRKSAVLQMATVSLSGAITVLLGLRVSAMTGVVLTNTALVLGAAVTVLSAYDAFFDHRKLWVVRTVTVRRLEELKMDLDFALAASGPGEHARVTAESFARLRTILAEDRREWAALRSEGDRAGDASVAQRPTSRI